MLHKPTFFLALSVVLLHSTAGAQSPVTWQNVQTIISSSDVDVTGSPVLAIAYSTGIASANVNGVTFLANPTVTVSADGIDTDAVTVQNGITADVTFPWGSIINPLSYPPSSLGTSYQSILNDGFVGYTHTGSPYTLTLSGLTVGQEYRAQFWIADYRSFGLNWSATISGSGSDINVPTLVYETATGGGTGSSVIGTFTAGASTQVFSFVTPTPELQAFQLRNITGVTTNATNMTWTVNFDFNCAVGSINPGTYSGHGVVGAGTFWNSIPGPPAYSSPYHSASARPDDGSADSGISATLNAAGYGAGPGTNIALLDSYAVAYAPTTQSFSFANVPDGTYNLVLYADDSSYNNAGSVFTVNATSLADITVGAITIASGGGGYPNFVLGDNCVIFPYLQVQGGNLTGYYGSTNYSDAGFGQFWFNGAQLQYIGPLGLVSPSLTVSPGATLNVASLAGGSSYTFGSGTTLTDYGTINGSVVIAGGAILTLGTSAGSAVSINGSLTISNGSTVLITLNSSAATNALVTGINSMTCGGSLNVNGLGTGYQAGDSLTLFKAAQYAGNFSSVTLIPSTPAPGLAWDTSQLSTGVLKVVTGSPQTALAAVFANNMVLQRGQAVPVWGTADPGRSITVSFGGQYKTTTAGPDGRWQVQLDPMPANAAAQNLTVNGSSQLVVTNVVVGEVWLASGQSNMAFPLSEATNSVNEIAAANFPLIRHMCVASTASLTAVSDVQLSWAWQVCSSNNAGNLSAVAYFFGRQLWQNLNVPIGLIESAYPGTPVEAWTSQSAQNAIPELQQLSAQELAQYNQGYSSLTFVPGTLFNAMIQPLIPYAMRGVIWYQGEQNAGSAAQGDEYRVQFPTLINDWRYRWQPDNLSFYFVQLAGYGEDTFTYVREAQLLTLQTVTNTGMAVAIDIGDPNNIHPVDKQDVGARLAPWALTNNYGQNVVCSGPLFKAYDFETNQIRLFFNYAGSGLMVGQKTGTNPVVEVVGGTLAGFEIAGTNGQYVTANAAIDGTTVVVSSPSVPSPVTARYAWTGYPTCNLYNRTGLPASPFRTWFNTNPPINLKANLSNSVATISFVIPNGITYWMQCKDLLTAPAWMPLTIPQTATGSLLTLPDALSNRVQRFYQVAQVPP